jgi:hypothetical protein
MNTYVDESINMTFERESQALIRKWDKMFEGVAKAPNFAKSGRSFTRMDAYNLGKQFEMYKAYENYCIHETASASDLGMLPKVATDLIAATYAISIAPLLTSMQTIPEQQGIVYFKKVSAMGMINEFPYNPANAQSRGELNPGDPIVTAKRGWVGDPMDYASEQVSNERIFVGASGNTEFAGTSDGDSVKMFPIRSNVPVRIVLTRANGTQQFGQFVNMEGGSSRFGTLMSSDGYWTGNIDFSNGQIELNIVGSAPAPQAADIITVSYMQDFETAADIPVIEMTLSSTDVIAEVLALKQNISTLKAFQFKQRFGRVAEDDALMDLAGTMADVESRRIIAGYVQMANWIERQSFSADRPIQFNLNTPFGQSDYEYRQGFRYLLSNADSEINLNCGRGAANRYIAGHKACEFIAALPKFVAAPANLAVGPHVFGYYDGKPVIRTTYLRGLVDPVNGGYADASNVIIATYLNPQSPFDAPMVSGTYMPVFITNTMQFGHNPFQNMRAIATWKAFKNVVPHYVKSIVLIDRPQTPLTINGIGQLGQLLTEAI